MKNIELQWELKDQALLTYKAALLTALEDVENALTAYSYELTRREHLLKESQSARLSAEISRSQYSSGLIDFQSVLDTERSLLSSQDQVAQSDAQVIINLISLYKALGGGWKNTSSQFQNAPLRPISTDNGLNDLSGSSQSLGLVENFDPRNTPGIRAEGPDEIGRVEISDPP